ncbi:MAG TPA: phosphoribosylformylglycinamidine synthase I [Chloroflexia bacterium]|nr:phosphoribosylformylglycinamidine synthase I [Chloroflexia bacterium]
MLEKKARVLVLRTAGINCDAEMVTAWELAGAEADLRHINEIAGPQASQILDHYTILAIPGGFSYGDDLGAGKLLANEMIYRLTEPFNSFVESGRPVLGVCNGFQVLAKTGLFGDLTLMPNRSGHFECRWTYLRNENSSSLFLRGIEQLYLPVAHGEGRVELGETNRLEKLESHEAESGAQIALRYCDESGNTQAGYPWNTNGSDGAIAGVTNRSGTVFGLMPHPERFVSPWQHPQWTRLQGNEGGLSSEGEGLKIFRNAVQYVVKEL